MARAASEAAGRGRRSAGPDGRRGRRRRSRRAGCGSPRRSETAPSPGRSMPGGLLVGGARLGGDEAADLGVGGVGVEEAAVLAGEPVIADDGSRRSPRRLRSRVEGRAAWPGAELSYSWMGKDGFGATRAGVIGTRALEARPAEVGAAGGALGAVVDLLAAALADVADRDRAGDRVEGEAERVAQADRVDLVAAGGRRRTGCRRGSCRSACGPGPSASARRRGRPWASPSFRPSRSWRDGQPSALPARVDSQDLAEQALGVLRVVGGSPPPPPSPVREVEEPSGPKAILPPLWLPKVGWGTSRTWRPLARDARNRCLLVALELQTTWSPASLVK